jgi:hypothetical protein
MFLNFYGAITSNVIWGSMFLKPEDLEKVRVSSLLSLVANTGFGLSHNLMKRPGDTMEQ